MAFHKADDQRREVCLQSRMPQSFCSARSSICIHSSTCFTRFLRHSLLPTRHLTAFVIGFSIEAASTHKSRVTAFGDKMIADSKSQYTTGEQESSAVHHYKLGDFTLKAQLVQSTLWLQPRICILIQSSPDSRLGALRSCTDVN